MLEEDKLEEESESDKTRGRPKKAVSRTFGGIRVHCVRLRSGQGAFLSGRTQTLCGRSIWMQDHMRMNMKIWS